MVMMRRLIIALSMSCAVFAQQPQADIVKTDVLSYDKSKTRIVVAVKNIATAELHNIWVKVQGTTSTTHRRKIPYLKPNDTRQVTVDAKSDDGPWRVDVESVDWLNQ